MVHTAPAGPQYPHPHPAPHTLPWLWCAEQLEAVQKEKDTQGVQLKKLRSKRAEQAKALDRSAAELVQAGEQRGQLHEELAQLQGTVLQRDVQIRDLQHAAGSSQLQAQQVAALEAQVLALQARARASAVVVALLPLVLACIFP